MNRTPAEQLVEALEARLNDLRDLYYHVIFRLTFLI